MRVLPGRTIYPPGRSSSLRRRWSSQDEEVGYKGVHRDKIHRHIGTGAAVQRRSGDGSVTGHAGGRRTPRGRPGHGL